MRPARVVAADALLRRAADVEGLVEEVGVGARRRVDDGPPVDEVELLLAPGRCLAALVLAVADRDRLLCERLAGVFGLEDQLDHLPVALVEVVPVVEDIEQPVLKREHAGVAGIADDVRVHRRLASLGDPAAPELVGATRLERVAGVVEVVLVEPVEVGSYGRDLYEIERIPRAAEGDRSLVEEDVDVDRLVGLPGAALLLLFDEPHHRCVALRELALVGERGRGARRRQERYSNGYKEGPHGSGFDAKRSSPRRRERNRATSCPFTLLPASSSGGANVPRPPLPGETVMIPPPIPLFPGSPTS